MDEFDQQVARARLDAERAATAEHHLNTLAEQAAAQASAVHRAARESLEVVWRRVHAAVTEQDPDPDTLFISRVGTAELASAEAAKQPRARLRWYMGMHVARRPLDERESTSIRQRNKVRAWQLSEQLALYVSNSDGSGTYYYRCFLAADGCVYCVDGLAGACRPDWVSSWMTSFTPGQDLAASAYMRPEEALANYGQIKMGLANLVVKHDLRI